MNQVIHVHKGKALIRLDKGLVTGDLPAIEVKKETPEIKWNGALIPSSLLRQTVKFAHYVYKRYGGECQWRLAYNEKREKWAVIVMRQYISQGLSSKECGEEGDIAKGLAQLDGDGWVINGSGHSHCDVSAFMSGTDEADERNQTGFHYTVGMLDNPTYDLHSRYSFRGLIYQFEDAECMFDKPNRKMKRLPAFPKEWLACMVERKVNTVRVSSSRQTAQRYPQDRQSRVYNWDHLRGNDYGFTRTQSTVPDITMSDYKKIRDMLMANYGSTCSMHLIIDALRYHENRHMTHAYRDKIYMCPFCGESVDHDGAACDQCLQGFAHEASFYGH